MTLLLRPHASNFRRRAPVPGPHSRWQTAGTSGWPPSPARTPVPGEACGFAAGGGEGQLRAAAAGGRREPEVQGGSSSDKGRAPYLGLHPLLRLKTGAQRGEREGVTVGAGRSDQRGPGHKEAEAGPWPQPPTALGQTLRQGFHRSLLWSSSPASTATAEAAGRRKRLLRRRREPGPRSPSKKERESPGRRLLPLEGCVGGGTGFWGPGNPLRAPLATEAPAPHGTEPAPRPGHARAGHTGPHGSSRGPGEARQTPSGDAPAAGSPTPAPGRQARPAPREGALLPRSRWRTRWRPRTAPSRALEEKRAGRQRRAPRARHGSREEPAAAAGTGSGAERKEGPHRDPLAPTTQSRRVCRAGRSRYSLRWPGRRGSGRN